MGVIVREAPEESPQQDRPAGLLTSTLLVLGAVAVLAGTGTSLTGVPAGTAEIEPLADAPAAESGRWLPTGAINARFLSPRWIGNAYLIESDAGTMILRPDGSTMESGLHGLEDVRGASTHGPATIVFGRGVDGPTLWTVNRTGEWDSVQLPWQGSVQAVATVDGDVVVLGTDHDREWISGRHPWPDDGIWDEWVVRPIDPPGTVVRSVDGGFVARSLTADEYLISEDGNEWLPFATLLIHPVGEVAAVESGTRPTLRLVGDDRVITPPEWPVSALWRIDDRIWIQTPRAAWWSDDGWRWNRLPFDQASGFVGGLYILLPFSDRAMIVGPTEMGRRDLYTWFLGD
ncbi:MAG: hypothetical protein WD020_00730 [Acidimicrobiia bacterium]